MHRTVLATLGFLASLSIPALAVAADGFGKLPYDQPGKTSALRIRVVRYDGGTNGTITVDVQNPTDRPQLFAAKGLYFVPKGNADSAPQRLGAVGPFRSSNAHGQQRQERMTVAAGAIERVALDVYCIDSHRASPSGTTSFRVAKDRMPDKLAKAIDDDARKSAAPYGGVSSAAPTAKAAVQSEVWRNRDAKWIELDGEGKQEADKRR